MHRAVPTLAALALSLPAVADGPVVRLDDLTPARDRVVRVPEPVEPSVAGTPWGVLQTIQIPIEGTVRGVHATGDAVVHVAPGRALRVTVKTDPGLLGQARALVVDGTLRLGHRRADVPAAWHVEGPLPQVLRAEEDALLEVAAWEGGTLEILAHGNAQVRLGHVRAQVVRVLARDGARVRIEGSCKAEDVWVDTSGDARFQGCGMTQGGRP